MGGDEKQSKTDDDGSDFLRNLLKCGSSLPVDSDVDAYELQLPEWYDDGKFKRAQQFFKRNLFAMYVAMLCGLLVILAVPSILNVLIYTKQSSTAMTAYRRYVATIMHTLNWYYEDLTPGSTSWKSIAYVRRTHAATSKRSSSKLSGRIIAQKDMAVTQFGFVGYVVLGYKKLGIQYSVEDMEAMVHFWRVIGYMIGIQDQYNICTDSLATTEQRMRQIQDHILRPALEERTEDFEEMGKALITGMWSFNPFLNYDAFLFLTARLTGVPGYHYWTEEHPSVGCETKYQKFSRYTRFVLYFLILIHEIGLKYTIVRLYLNSQMVMSRFLITYFPFLAIPKFGFRNSYVRILK
ncbi:rubber oxygenase [Culex quinquefasciatus]|uniref:rubber oxygenase n=1 Tax=Culex quinquefasciatus TaxID=7176 RepID=UPI0018E2B86B|nr:rubber oxygenase [Culex quinquefasciatus]